MHNNDETFCSVALIVGGGVAFILGSLILRLGSPWEGERVALMSVGAISTGSGFASFLLGCMFRDIYR